MIWQNDSSNHSFKLRNIMLCHLLRFVSGVAYLVGGIVEEVGPLAEVLGRPVELLLLLAPVVDRLLQGMQSEKPSKP